MDFNSRNSRSKFWKNLKQYEMVPSTCQPRHNCGLIQGWSCSPHGIWFRIVLSQGLGWWRVFAGRQTFGFCLGEHLKLGGTRSLAWSVHTLFFFPLCSALYHYMFASCMNSCGGLKGSGQPRHFPGKWGPFTQGSH